MERKLRSSPQPFNFFQNNLLELQQSNSVRQRPQVSCPKSASGRRAWVRVQWQSYMCHWNLLQDIPTADICRQGNPHAGSPACRHMPWVGSRPPDTSPKGALFREIPMVHNKQESILLLKVSQTVTVFGGGNIFGTWSRIEAQTSVCSQLVLP